MKILLEILAPLLEWLRSLFGKKQPKQKRVHTQTHPANKPMVVNKAEPLLYEGEDTKFDENDINAAMAILHYEEEGKHIGPTASQEKVIFSKHVATLVGAGAGSGKSTTLVSRILFLHKYCKQSFSYISVFTFTRKSRKDFIEKLVKEAKRWGIDDLDEKKATRIVKTFHSKLLSAAKSIMGPRTRIFEFIGTEKEKYEDVKSLEEAADEIESPFSIDETLQQLTIKKDAYTAAYNSDETFRLAVHNLWLHTLSTEVKVDQEKFDKKKGYLSLASKIDETLCNHLEEKWTELGCWPIEGVLLTDKNDHRFSLNLYGERFHANGYIPSLDIYILLWSYPNASRQTTTINSYKINPFFSARDKVNFVSQLGEVKIKVIYSKKDCENLQKQLAIGAGIKGKSSPMLDMKPLVNLV